MSVSSTVETSGTTLEPGGGASVSLTVSNDGDLVDEYRFRVVGALAPWARTGPATVSVHSGGSVTVTALFHVPRSWKVPAGDAPFGVQVLPFWDTSAELVPRTLEGRAGGRHRVAVDNRGATPTVAVELVATDPAERLQLVLGPSTMRIAVGTVQSADLQVRPRHRIWRGAQQAHPFTVEVRPDTGPGTVLAGAHRRDPLLPGWSPRLLTYLAVLALLGVLVTFVVAGVVPAVQGFVAGAAGGIERIVDGLTGAGGEPVQGGEDRSREDQGGGDPDGGAAGGELEEVVADLTDDAEPGAFGQNLREVADDRTVFTSVVLRASSGDDGIFLSLGGAPITQQFAMRQIQGGEQEFSLGQQGIPANAGRGLQLGLRCDSADNRPLPLPLPDVCGVTAELRGVVIPRVEDPGS